MSSTKTKTILLAHGSSDPDWSNAFVTMTEPVVTQTEDIELAFMELSEPSLEQAILEAKSSGYTDIKVLPLFLAQGRHLKKDVPGMLKTYEERYEVQTELLAPIGEHPAMSKAIDTIINESI